MADTLLAQRLHQHAYRTGEFTLASGERSSEYLDVRGAICNPRVNRPLLHALAGFAATEPPVDAVAGVVLGGALLAQLFGHELHKPVLPVRPLAKEHGLAQSVEGLLNLPDAGMGAAVYLLEDVITSGGSALKALRHLADQGIIVRRLIAVVDRQQGGLEAIAKEFPAVPVVALTTLAEVRAAVPVAVKPL